MLLCASKNDAVVKFTLPEGQKQIFASQYELYLPTEQQLLEELNKELEILRKRKLKPLPNKLGSSLSRSIAGVLSVTMAFG